MWVKSVDLRNIACFAKAELELSQGINILVGPNNAGKSTVLRLLLSLQYEKMVTTSMLRLGEQSGSAQIIFGGDTGGYFRTQIDGFSLQLPSMSRTLAPSRGAPKRFAAIEPKEPGNFIYPYLSSRKSAKFGEAVNVERALQLSGNLENLYARIDRITNPQLPAYDDYMGACEDILGIAVTCTHSPNGKRAVYMVEGRGEIPVDAMGEGVPNVLSLIVDLSLAREKLFLLEEPENDIHPRALRKVLRLIAKRSKNNQFLVTTHSNIVTKFLGSQPSSKVFSVAVEFDDGIPNATLKEVGASTQERRDVLEDLGYELYDFDLWQGWLFLEESSAEKIIRDFLIPRFSPGLVNKLRTFSARSRDEIEPKFEDFNRLFVFLHLQEVYKNKVWLIIDGGEDEKRIITRMQETYAARNWSPDHFQQFAQHDFERYYPRSFQDKVEAVLKLGRGREKQKQKKDLLQEVERWIAADAERAKQEFQESAAEVIEKLREIERILNS